MKTEEETWRTEHELLATLIEVTSVGATERARLKKPITIPRPKGDPGPAGPSDAGMQKAFGVLAATARG